MNPSEKRLALLVQDHPLDYIGFEGVILHNLIEGLRIEELTPVK